MIGRNPGIARNIGRISLCQNAANGSGRRRLRGGCVREGIRRATSSRAPVLVLKPALAAAVRRTWVLWRFMYNLACWSVMCVPGKGGSLPGS